MAQNNEEEVPEKSALAQSEEQILHFWKEKNIFKKSLELPSPEGEFVFYEGPPTANGRPGIHHLEARAFKDLIPRYKTMRGFHVGRKAGWDTHGLPVELEVEKKLGLKSKKEIETYGIAAFNKQCKESVWTYVDEWKEFTDRIGYFIDMENPYITYKPQYIESVWSILKDVADKNLLYKDYKVVPWCPRCGTALSSHELAQGYETVKDLSVYAKFKVEGRENTFLLAWTTTPWTLPGNIALAVGEDIDYVEVEIAQSKEYFILAKNKLSLIEEAFEVVREIKGKDLVGMKYEPLFSYLSDALPAKEKEKAQKAWQVYTANFVTTEDGTGIVHTAVMYGQDDFELGTKMGLPKFHLVDDTGHFISLAGPFAGKFVKDEEVAVDIIKDLAHRGLLFKKEKYEHTYPFCWRCKTPLIYYARDSWYIRMSSLRETLLEENQKINWEPSFIRDGRFGEWLREVKDWAISRERYWGTPLPIWTNADGSEQLVIDSIDTLKTYTKHNHNNFFVVRHAGSAGNEKGVVSFANESEDHLTAEGEAQAKVSATELKAKNIDVIISSPFTRTKETAQIFAKEFGIAEDEIVFDERLGEINPGTFDGKSWNEYHNYMYTYGSGWFESPIPEGESLQAVAKRVGECLYDLESKYKQKNILIVTHGGPAWLSYVIAGLTTIDAVPDPSIDPSIFIKGFQNAEVRELPFVPLPHNENFELDLHRPYIDETILISSTGQELRRIKEVADVWFDSGAMPFAQHHYPFENKAFVDAKGYPADFISEAIDQTRGWFYTLHAIGVLLGKGRAYKNVICLGHILDKDGQKMSKSRGNAVSPWDLISKYGVDPLRFWMYTVNQPGESKNFDERTVDEIVKKVFNLLQNVVSFYELYGAPPKNDSKSVSNNPLDIWILTLLNSTIQKVTENLDAFKPLEAGREIRNFIGELSQWYVRRSRDRFKDEDSEERYSATETLRFVLLELSKLLAPFTPFFAESMYQKVKGEDGKESVHLERWPKIIDLQGESVLSDMAEVRRIVSLALEARSKANIKIRQPLAKLSVLSESLQGKADLLAIIADEINVKEVIVQGKDREEVELDLNITPELQREGDARELIRAIQEARKQKNLNPQDVISLKLSVTEKGKETTEFFLDEIKKVCNISTVEYVPLNEEGGWFKVVIE